MIGEFTTAVKKIANHQNLNKEDTKYLKVVFYPVLAIVIFATIWGTMTPTMRADALNWMTSETVTDASGNGPLQPNGNQPLIGAATPTPTEGQEKECSLYYANGQCEIYKDGTKGAKTQVQAPVAEITPHQGKNRLKSVWSKEEVEGTNIKNSPDPDIIFGRLPEIYNDKIVAVRGSIIDERGGTGGAMVKNIGTVPVTIIIKVKLLDLTLQQQDAYPNGIEYVSGKIPLKPGRTASADIFRAGTKKFEITVQYT
jgi:hypothetical protein